MTLENGAEAMDQRDPPRFGSSDGRLLDSSTEERDDVSRVIPGLRHFPRLLNESMSRHWSGGRVATVAVISSGVLIAVIGIGSWFLRQGLAVVHTQEKATLNFRQITLDPPPPRWYAGGSEAFLDRVVTQSKLPETFAVLDLDVSDLRRAFKLNPIVETAIKVQKEFPNRVIVSLEFREPVAKAKLPNRTDFLLLDRNGVILPQDAINIRLARPLVELHGFSAPEDPRDGHRWYTLDPGNKAKVPDERVSDASRLAGFLRDKLVAEPTFPLPGYIYLHRNARSETGFFLQLGANLMFRWERAGSRFEDAGLSDETRWRMVRDWVKTHPPLEESRTYDDLEFTPRGVTSIETRKKPASEGTQAPD